MTILICTGIFPPEIGGPATYSKILAEELSKLGHIVKVITYSDHNPSQPPLASRGGVPPLNIRGGEGELSVIRIQRSRFKPLHYYKYYRAVLKHGRNAGVIYAQGPVSEGYPAYLAAKKLDKPLVVKITGDYSWEQAMNRGLTDKMIDEFQTLKNFPSQIRKMRKIQKLVCDSAEVVITPSEYLKKIVTGWGVNPAKIKVIYNSVERPAIIDQRSAIRDKLGISENTFLIVSSGRDVPWKGFELLREVVVGLKTSNPEVELKILHDSPQQELHEWIASADIYVLNTGYEGLSNTLVEVLHIGTPIITTNVGGNPEIIRDGENGLLVEYNNAQQLKDAILKLCFDKELLNKLRNNSGLERFDLKEMISKTEEVLKQCAS